MTERPKGVTHVAVVVGDHVEMTNDDDEWYVQYFYDWDEVNRHIDALRNTAVAVFGPEKKL